MKNKERVNKFKSEKVAIHCETEEEASEFIKWCYANGFEWGFSKSDETHFEIHEDKTCYTFNFCDCECLGYGSKHFHEEKGYEVIKYKDFMKEKKMNNLEYYASKDLINIGTMLCSGAHICKHGVDCREKEYGCSECEFNDVDLCVQALIQEHKEPIKLKQWEYDLLKAKLETHGYCYFSACIDLSNMKDNGYFKSVTDTSVTLQEILDNCEVVEDGVIRTKK